MRISNPFRRLDIGIDLGTANTLVVEPGLGVTFDQPSVCCFRAYDAVPICVAAGDEARSFVGRVARPLKIVHPLRNGVLSDMVAASELLKFVARTLRPRSGRLRRVHPVIGVPADATDAERRSLLAAASDAGFVDARLVAEPLLAAIGIGLDVDAPRGRMIVDCGAGTTEVAVISLGAICTSESVRGGGDALDLALVEHLRARHRFDIGPASAEALKRSLSGALSRREQDAVLEIRGTNAAEGLPQTLMLPVSEILGVWDRHVAAIVSAVHAALAETPASLAEDILEDGIVLTGGAAQTGLLAERIAESTSIATRVAGAPLRSVADGLQRVLEQRL